MRKINNIIYIADTEEVDTFGLKRAIKIASENKSKLTVVDVLPIPPVSVERYLKNTTGSQLGNMFVKQRLETLEKATKKQLGTNTKIKLQVLLGIAPIEIIKLVIKEKFDLLIKTANPETSINSVRFGSLDLQLLRKCPVPVWIIKSDQKKIAKRILVAINPDPENKESAELNEHILEFSQAIQKANNSELHVVHAWRLYGESLLLRRDEVPGQEISELLKEEEMEHINNVDKMLKEMSLNAKKVHIEHGKASDVILNTASKINADLVILGTVARTGLPGIFIGNTAEVVLESIKTSVLALKPEGFVSPIS